MLDRAMDDPVQSETLELDVDGTVRDGYIQFLKQVVPTPSCFQGLRVLLDCANGSACEIAPAVFRHYGAEVVTRGDRPNGRNINMDCGSLHLDALAESVRAEGFDLGLAFDGDADRCLAVDRRGRVVDGDHILFITGRRLKRLGRLRGDALVATIMSNFWLEERLAADGIELRRAPVGDKYVLQRMIEDDLALGGEQSGHIIFRDHSTTGDGILTGILLIEALLDESEKLDEIVDGIVPRPQILLNVRVREKQDLRSHATIGPEVSAIEQDLDGTGRVVLRYSGTEPLARVMVEGPDEAAVRQHAQRLAALIGDELGE